MTVKKSYALFLKTIHIKQLQRIFCFKGVILAVFRVRASKHLPTLNLTKILNSKKKEEKLKNFHIQKVLRISKIKTNQSPHNFFKKSS